MLVLALKLGLVRWCTGGRKWMTSSQPQNLRRHILRKDCHQRNAKGPKEGPWSVLEVVTFIAKIWKHFNAFCHCFSFIFTCLELLLNHAFHSYLRPAVRYQSGPTPTLHLHLHTYFVHREPDHHLIRDREPVRSTHSISPPNNDNPSSYPSHNSSPPQLGSSHFSSSKAGHRLDSNDLSTVTSLEPLEDK